MRIPDFFIVGQTRSGTNSLQFQLEQHPEIFISNKTKTIFGFNKQINSEQEYINQFLDIKEKIIGERNTDCLIHPTSALKIHGLNPNAKIIIILRNPIDVMYSLHSASIHRGLDENILDFEQALKMENSRKLEEEKYPGKYSPFIFYNEIGKYSKQVLKYLELFDKEKILVLKFEDFIDSSKKEYKKIYNFLEVDTNFIPIIESKNPDRSVRSKKLQKSVDHIQKTQIQKIIKLFPLIGIVYSKVNRPKASRNKLNPILKRKILTELKSDIDNLSNILNADFSSWYKE